MVLLTHGAAPLGPPLPSLPPQRGVGLDLRAGVPTPLRRANEQASAARHAAPALAQIRGSPRRLQGSASARLPPRRAADAAPGATKSALLRAEVGTRVAASFGKQPRLSPDEWGDDSGEGVSDRRLRMQNDLDLEARADFARQADDLRAFVALLVTQEWEQKKAWAGVAASRLVELSKQAVQHVLKHVSCASSRANPQNEAQLPPLLRGLQRLLGAKLAQTPALRAWLNRPGTAAAVLREARAAVDGLEPPPVEEVTPPSEWDEWGLRWEAAGGGGGGSGGGSGGEGSVAEALGREMLSKAWQQALERLDDDDEVEDLDEGEEGVEEKEGVEGDEEGGGGGGEGEGGGKGGTRQKSIRPKPAEKQAGLLAETQAGERAALVATQVLLLEHHVELLGCAWLLRGEPPPTPSDGAAAAAGGGGAGAGGGGGAGGGSKGGGRRSPLVAVAPATDEQQLLEAAFEPQTLPQLPPLAPGKQAEEAADTAMLLMQALVAGWAGGVTELMGREVEEAGWLFGLAPAELARVLGAQQRESLRMLEHTLIGAGLSAAEWSSWQQLSDDERALFEDAELHRRMLPQGAQDAWAALPVPACARLVRKQAALRFVGLPAPFEPLQVVVRRQTARAVARLPQASLPDWRGRLLALRREHVAAAAAAAHACVASALRLLRLLPECAMTPQGESDALQQRHTQLLDMQSQLHRRLARDVASRARGGGGGGGRGGRGGRGPLPEEADDEPPPPPPLGQKMPLPLPSFGALWTTSGPPAIGVPMPTPTPPPPAALTPRGAVVAPPQPQTRASAVRHDDIFSRDWQPKPPSGSGGGGAPARPRPSPRATAAPAAPAAPLPRAPPPQPSPRRDGGGAKAAKTRQNLPPPPSAVRHRRLDLHTCADTAPASQAATMQGKSLSARGRLPPAPTLRTSDEMHEHAMAIDDFVGRSAWMASLSALAKRGDV